MVTGGGYGSEDPERARTGPVSQRQPSAVSWGQLSSSDPYPTIRCPRASAQITQVELIQGPGYTDERLQLKLRSSSSPVMQCMQLQSFSVVFFHFAACDLWCPPGSSLSMDSSEAEHSMYISPWIFLTQDLGLHLMSLQWQAGLSPATPKSSNQKPTP